MPAEFLRHELARLEGQFRFQGRPYPEGMAPFPRALVGQGFFPGGDGLWRDDDPVSLREPSPYPFPEGGIMFLGNDFGTYKKFQQWTSHESPPTWRHLRRRLRLAGIPGHYGFYTNAYLGLRTDRTALDAPIEEVRYREMCAEFLDIQLRCQLPRLVVALGPPPVKLLRSVLGLPDGARGIVQHSVHEGRQIAVVTTTHPFCDHYREREPLRLQEEGDILARAWAASDHPQVSDDPTDAATRG